jgi:hypothetical protein
MKTINLIIYIQIKLINFIYAVPNSHLTRDEVMMEELYSEKPEPQFTPSKDNNKRALSFNSPSAAGSSKMANKKDDVDEETALIGNLLRNLDEEPQTEMIGKIKAMIKKEIKRLALEKQAEMNKAGSDTD